MNLIQTVTDKLFWSYFCLILFHFTFDLYPFTFDLYLIINHGTMTDNTYKHNGRLLVIWVWPKSIEWILNVVLKVELIDTWERRKIEILCRIRNILSFFDFFDFPADHVIWCFYFLSRLLHSLSHSTRVNIRVLMKMLVVHEYRFTDNSEDLHLIDILCHPSGIRIVGIVLSFTCYPIGVRPSYWLCEK